MSPINEELCYALTTVDEAVEGCHFGLFLNMGQVCTAGSRLFVHENIYDEFLKKAVNRAEKRTVGDPFQDGIESGPQARNILCNLKVNCKDDAS